MDYIAEIPGAFLKLHGCNAIYLETVPVVEEFQGQTIWQGDVEVFELEGHPKATRGYGWSHVTGEHDQGRRYFTILELPPVDSPQTAVKAAIMSEIKNARQKKKVGRPPLAKGEAKTIVLQSRVQESERVAYMKAAKSQGKDLSTWIRDTLNMAVGEPHHVVGRHFR